jgi:hypothetical protein
VDITKPYYIIEKERREMKGDKEKSLKENGEY